MGIGSPRLLRLVPCGCALALAALWFTPSAFADDGVVLSASASVGPVQTNVAVADPAANVTATPAPARPALSETPATSTLSGALAPVVAPRRPTSAPVDLRIAPTRAASESFAEASAPARHSMHRGDPQVARSRGHKPLPQGAGRAAGADALPSPARQLTHHTPRQRLPLVSTAARTHAGSPVPPQRPQPPLPGPLDVVGAASPTAAAGTAVLLFAVATALGFLTFPLLARVLATRSASARPHPYHLRLERPD